MFWDFSCRIREDCFSSKNIHFETHSFKYMRPRKFKSSCFQEVVWEWHLVINLSQLTLTMGVKVGHQLETYKVLSQLNTDWKKVCLHQVAVPQVLGSADLHWKKEESLIQLQHWSDRSITTETNQNGIINVDFFFLLFLFWT